MWVKVAGVTFICFQLFADQVEMKNGDRLTGSIIKMDGKLLTLKSEYAGPVTLPWDAVTGITATAPLHFGLQDGQLVVGTATLTGDKFQIQTSATGSISPTRESVKFIRSNEEEAAYEAEVERYRNPRLLDLWAGFVDLGFAETRGNAQTSTINVSANAIRETKRDKISTYFTSLYASNSASGPSLVTANAIRGGVSYNLNLSARTFAFASVDLEFDEFQKLDLRFSPAGGFGYHAIKTDRSSLDLMAGAALNREFFSTGLRRTSGEALLGEEYDHKLSRTSSIHEKLTVYPNITDTGRFRANFDTALVTVLRKWLSWQFTFSDRYLSDPVPGRKKNDVLLTTGVRVSFQK